VRANSAGSEPPEGRGSSARSQAFPQRAAELLDLGQYEKLADLMSLSGGARVGGRGAQPVRDEVLDSVRVMCEACSETRAEAAWHHEALSRIQMREQDLKERLKAAIDLISAECEDEQKEPATFWRRIPGLGRGRGSLRAGPGTSAEPSASHAPAEGAPESSLSMAVYCLGEFRVYFAGRFVEEWSNAKGKAIFKFLVTEPQHRAGKEVLMERFWPNAEPHAARNCLNVAIYGLRRAFSRVHPSSVVLFGDDSYYLNPELDVWIDHEAFTAHFTAGQQLERRGETASAMHEYRRAEALYQGEFLQEDRYEDWPDPLRRSLRDRYLMLLGRLGQYVFEQQDYAACVELCRKMLAVDPCHEDAHLRLMLCWSRQGLSNLALRQYHLCREELGRELEVEPSPATTELFDRIRHRLPV
jgi:DNA-binding SARP family transcriptional activator